MGTYYLTGIYYDSPSQIILIDKKQMIKKFYFLVFSNRGSLLSFVSPLDNIGVTINTAYFHTSQ